MIDKQDCQPLGDTGLRVAFGDKITLNTHRKIRRFCKQLAHHSLRGVKEWVPAYTSVTIYYSPVHTTYQELITMLTTLEEGGGDSEVENSRLVKIPVCYEGDYGLDLDEVAHYNQLSPEEVIYRHTQAEYLVYMMGFMPGFPYLGGMDPHIGMPRRQEPRSHIAAGSVGIAGRQTGIYPLPSPGGWRVIGRTPLRLYDPTAKIPTLLRIGDRLQFFTINKAMYRRLEEKDEETN